MENLNKILIAFLIVGFLSSCTQRRYSHVTGFQLNNKAKTAKTFRSGHYVATDKTTFHVDVVDAKRLVTDNSETIEVPPTQVNAPQVFKKRNKSSKSTMSVNEVKSLPKLLKEVNQVTAPQNVYKKVKKGVAKKTKAGGLIYWILVLILVILIVSLLETVLGTALTRIIITVALIAFIGHLIGLW